MITEQDINALRIELRKEMASMKDDISANSDAIENLKQVQAEVQGPFAEILNLLDNSQPEYSVDSFTTLAIEPNSAGDGNLECYDYFRQLAADTVLSQSSDTHLKAPKTIEPADHTLWAANEAVNAEIPRWNKVDGWFELGGATNKWELITPIHNDVIYPGQRFYIQFEAMMATGDLPAGMQAYAGLWDNTTGQQKFLEGGAFTITGEIFGTAGTRTVEYRAVAYTDAGEQAISNILTFTNAPDEFTGQNHPRIHFAGVPGFIKFEIYRHIGGQFVKQYTVGNTFEGSYYDIGDPPQAIISDWPTVSLTKPRAYAQTNGFAPGTPTGLGWVRHVMTVFVPTTYNRGLTQAGQQYLRIGLTGLTASPRQILFRRLGLSMGNGKWARSPNDIRYNAHSRTSTTATQAGAGSTDGHGIDPPPPPGGGDTDKSGFFDVEPI